MANDCFCDPFWVWSTFLAGGLLLLYIRRRFQVRQRQHEAELHILQEDLANWRDKASNAETRAYQEARKVEKAESEATRWKRIAETLTGEPGEDIADAAKRFGIEIRYKAKSAWVGRRGNDTYWAIYPPERSEPSVPPKVVFTKADDAEDPFVQAERFFDLDKQSVWEVMRHLESGEEFRGWKFIERGTEDLEYQKQRFDGDFLTYWVVVDPIGRRIYIDDHLGSRVMHQWEW